MKDPAFLFYSKDFYEGTRMMLPEERACYIDLMIYQHQNGFIPNEPKRLLMYCSGVCEAMLIATLEAKFELTDKGWVNTRLFDVINQRKEFSSKQSTNGSVGAFWKKVKSLVSTANFFKIKESLSDMTNEELNIYINNNDLKNEAKLKAMLEAMLKHLVIANAIVIKGILSISNTLNKKEEKNNEIIECGDLIDYAEVIENDFNLFWDMYDKKVGKDKAEKLFNSLPKKEIEKIFLVLENYIKSTPDKKFRKDPATWLRNKCWNDEINLNNYNNGKSKITDTAEFKQIAEAIRNNTNGIRY